MGRKTLGAVALLTALGLETTAYAGISPDTYDILTLSNGDSISGPATLALTGANWSDNADAPWITILDTTPFTAPELSTWATIGIAFATLSLAGYRAKLTALSVM